MKHVLIEAVVKDEATPFDIEVGLRSAVADYLNNDNHWRTAPDIFYHPYITPQVVVAASGQKYRDFPFRVLTEDDPL